MGKLGTTKGTKLAKFQRELRVARSFPTRFIVDEEMI
jgi:hypothetical protein